MALPEADGRQRVVIERVSPEELADYFRELTATDVKEFFRPNLWPTTPDILPEFLQVGGRPAFMIRLILAATLGSSYGIYGPAFELGENTAVQPGNEEYLNSEKYELKHRDLHASWSLKDLITRVNHARKENPALRSNNNLRFHETDNPKPDFLQQGNRRSLEGDCCARQSRCFPPADRLGSSRSRVSRGGRESCLSGA